MTEPGARARVVPWSVMTLLSCVIALYAALVTLRIILPAEIAAGVPFHDAYQAVAWACWVPNLIVAEWFFLRPQQREAT